MLYVENSGLYGRNFGQVSICASPFDLGDRPFEPYIQTKLLKQIRLRFCVLSDMSGLWGRDKLRVQEDFDDHELAGFIHGFRTTHADAVHTFLHAAPVPV
jgi:hypothetical protein